MKTGTREISLLKECLKKLFTKKTFYESFYLSV